MAPQRRNSKQQKFNKKDYISRLPDDILLIILSHLEITEAAKTNIFSTRWRNLWTFITTRLNVEVSNNCKLQKTVDQILQQHRGQSVDELRITYPKCWLPKLAMSWIKIAIQKQLKTLDLNLSFQLMESFGSTTFVSLVTLRLRFARISSHLMELFLSNSPNLQELSIVSSQWEHWDKARMKINGSCLKLKQLELVDSNIHALEISAPNLVSFRWISGASRTKLYVKDISQLTHLSYSEGFNIWYDFCKVLPQLESLTLVLSSFSTEAVELPHFPTLKNLKQMRVSLGNDLDRGLLLFLRLFGASPSLCRLWLNLETQVCPNLIRTLFDDCPKHQCLKEVEIDGYSGCDSELELVLCIARSCPSLEKMIIHLRYLKYLKYESDYFFTRQVYVESVVERLRSQLPQKGLEINLRDDMSILNSTTKKISGLILFDSFYC